QACLSSTRSNLSGVPTGSDLQLKLTLLKPLRLGYILRTSGAMHSSFFSTVVSFSLARMTTTETRTFFGLSPSQATGAATPALQPSSRAAARTTRLGIVIMAPPSRRLSRIVVLVRRPGDDHRRRPLAPAQAGYLVLLRLRLDLVHLDVVRPRELERPKQGL